jgi:hypothetical protein
LELGGFEIILSLKAAPSSSRSHRSIVKITSESSSASKQLKKLVPLVRMVNQEGGPGKQTRTTERTRNNPSSAPSNEELLLSYSLQEGGGRPPLEQGGERRSVLVRPFPAFHGGDRPGYVDTTSNGRQQHEHQEETQPEPRMSRTQSRSRTPPSRRSIIHDAIDRTLELVNDDADSLYMISDNAATPGGVDEDPDTSNRRGTQQDDDEDPLQ